MNNEIKSCVLHNFFKVDFALHTFSVVLWDSWTSVSQDKMIKQHEDEALKVVLFELLNASFSLFDTKMNEQKSHQECFFWKVLFSWMRDNETINWINGPSPHMPKVQPNIQPKAHIFYYLQCGTQGFSLLIITSSSEYRTHQFLIYSMLFFQINFQFLTFMYS